MINNFKFALLGEAVSYSLSPAIFKAIFEIAGIEGECLVFDIPDNQFESKLVELFEFADGISVTIPYKTKIIKHLNRVDPIAEKINAVNSIFVKDKKKIGYNTDSFGFSFPIIQTNRHNNLNTALVLGNGGAAKAICYALENDIKCSKVYIASRNLEKTKTIINDLSESNIFEAIDYNMLDQKIADGADLIINCTPLGGANYPEQLPLDDNLSLKANTVYYDLNYNQNNRMLERCQNNNLPTIDGSAMLIAQAIKSFELWTGITIDFDLLYHKVFKIES